jgi:hypothetical protein
MSKLTVKIAHDQRANVWVTWASEVPGLTAIDETKPGLVDQIQKVVPELLNLSRESTRLHRDNEYEIVIVDQTPPVSSEQILTSPAYVYKSFHVSWVGENARTAYWVVR